MRDVVFWDIARLKQQLANGLSEQQAFAYVIALLLLTGGATLLPGAEWSVWMPLGDAAMLVVALFGTWTAYQRNGGKNGVRFVERYLALGLVTCLRWLVLCAIPLAIIFGAAMETWKGLPSELTLVESALITVLVAGYYLRLIQHMSDVANA